MRAQRRGPRALEEREARPVPGTDGAHRPFWSPDGRSIGFFANGQLRRIAGVEAVLGELRGPLGGVAALEVVERNIDRFSLDERRDPADPYSRLDATARMNLRLSWRHFGQVGGYAGSEWYVRLDNVLDEVTWSQVGLPESGRMLRANSR